MSRFWPCLHSWTQWRHAWVRLEDHIGTEAMISLYRYCKKCGRLESKPKDYVSNVGTKPIDMSKLHHFIRRSQS